MAYGCIHPKKALWTFNNAQIFGGSAFEYEDYVALDHNKLDLTICVGNNPKFSDPVKIFGDLPQLEEYTKSRHFGKRLVSLNWSDYSGPHMSADFWYTLVDFIRTDVNGHVYVHCVGGHGRTGSTLAILAWLTKATKKDPVKWIRKIYCADAVESVDQLEYIEGVLGITTHEQPAKVYGGTSGTSKNEYVPGKVGNTIPMNQGNAGGSEYGHSRSPWDFETTKIPTDLEIAGHPEESDNDFLYRDMTSNYWYAIWGEKLTTDYLSSKAMVKAKRDAANRRLAAKGL